MSFPLSTKNSLQDSADMRPYSRAFCVQNATLIMYEIILNYHPMILPLRTTPTSSSPNLRLLLLLIGLHVRQFQNSIQRMNQLIRPV